MRAYFGFFAVGLATGWLAGFCDLLGVVAGA